MNKEQTKILLTKILPRFLVIGIVVIGLITLVVGRIWGEKIKKENDEWFINPENKEKIDSVLNNKKSINSRQLIKNDCETYIEYNNIIICLPKYENWIEISKYEDFKEIEFIDNKILGYYLNEYKINKALGEDLLKYNSISLFVSEETSDLIIDENVLNIVSNGMKNAYEFMDMSELKKIIENDKPNLTTGEQTFFIDSYSIRNKSRTIVSIMTSSKNNSHYIRLIYLNILNIKERLFFLNYSLRIDDHINLENETLENEKIVTKLLEIN